MVAIAAPKTMIRKLRDAALQNVAAFFALRVIDERITPIQIYPDPSGRSAGLEKAVPKNRLLENRRFVPSQ